MTRLLNSPIGILDACLKSTVTISQTYAMTGQWEIAWSSQSLACGMFNAKIHCFAKDVCPSFNCVRYAIGPPRVVSSWFSTRSGRASWLSQRAFVCIEFCMIDSFTRAVFGICGAKPHVNFFGVDKVLERKEKDAPSDTASRKQLLNLWCRCEHQLCSQKAMWMAGVL